MSCSCSRCMGWWPWTGKMASSAGLFDRRDGRVHRNQVPGRSSSLTGWCTGKQTASMPSMRKTENSSGAPFLMPGDDRYLSAWRATWSIRPSPQLFTPLTSRTAGSSGRKRLGAAGAVRPGYRDRGNPVGIQARQRMQPDHHRNAP